MSGKKQFKEQADEGFLRAAWDLEADMRLTAGCVVVIELKRTKRKGVWELALGATGNAAVWKKCTIERYSVEWPRAEVATLAAALFQAMHKLDLQLGEAITASWEAWEDVYEESASGG
jgi:hypothetical protein